MSNQVTSNLIALQATSEVFQRSAVTEVDYKITSKS